MQAPRFGWRSASDRLGAWNFYFIAKAALVALGLVDFHLAANLAFAVALAAMAHPRARALRPWLATPVAIALAYYDSRLPGIGRVVSQAHLVSSFSFAYLAELAGRFVSWKVIAIVAIVLAACIAASRFVRLDVAVAALIVALPLWFSPSAPIDADAAASSSGPSPRARPAGPDATVAEFFRNEAGRRVTFTRPPQSAPFDVIFLHVCSLSWDDLRATGLDRHPLLSEFDIVLRRFNAVSTYSGPAAIRLLRAPCGQPRHPALYTPAAPQCLLMPELEQAGFETQVALNHDGHFDDFLDHVRAQGVQALPVPLKGIDAPLRAFDDSRIYDDAEVLARWRESRAKSPARRVALYYNTLSLHDGNHFASGPSVKSSETYKRRLAKLLDEMRGFMDELGASGRRAIVVFIPEHGAALRGDASQIAGLREIPTPAITLVPVGIRVVGPDARRADEAVSVDAETSFLAVSQIVAAMLARPPFGDGFRAADYTADIPVTPFVSEGETDIVLKRDNGYVVRHAGESWRALR
jgi:cellulose synthase operon protein YhjU